MVGRHGLNEMGAAGFWRAFGQGAKAAGEKGLFWGGACYGILKRNGGAERCGP